MNLQLRYDPEADAIFISFRDLPPGSVAGAEPIDERRLVHCGHDGGVGGVEFLEISRGVEIDGLSEAPTIRRAIRSMAALSGAA